MILMNRNEYATDRKRRSILVNRLMSWSRRVSLLVTKLIDRNFDLSSVWSSSTTLEYKLSSDVPGLSDVKVGTSLYASDKPFFSFSNMPKKEDQFYHQFIVYTKISSSNVPCHNSDFVTKWCIIVTIMTEVADPMSQM